LHGAVFVRCLLAKRAIRVSTHRAAPAAAAAPLRARGGLGLAAGRRLVAPAAPPPRPGPMGFGGPPPGPAGRRRGPGPGGVLDFRRAAPAGTRPPRPRVGAGRRGRSGARTGTEATRARPGRGRGAGVLHIMMSLTQRVAATVSDLELPGPGERAGWPMALRHSQQVCPPGAAASTEYTNHSLTQLSGPEY
jgi:hypothetical protein